MDTNHNSRLFVRWSLVVCGAIALHWTTYYLCAGYVPIEHSIKLLPGNESSSFITLPFGISRWFDVLAGLLIVAVIVYLFPQVWKIRDELVKLADKLPPLEKDDYVITRIIAEFFLIYLIMMTFFVLITGPLMPEGEGGVIPTILLTTIFYGICCLGAAGDSAPTFIKLKMGVILGTCNALGLGLITAIFYGIAFGLCVLLGLLSSLLVLIAFYAPLSWLIELYGKHMLDKLHSMAQNIGDWLTGY